MENLSRDPLIY